ncbi:MAG: hypothetical protein H3C64_10305 [Candidatus Kuenenia stuttgartiensis]|nr:hypothetical protein [Candidatus Kuenenia stuttgartiensis]MCZ2442697.1 hypothetical protein [Flavobacteriales bacterium]
MEQAFKNFLYAGVELAASLSEKFEASVNDLVKKGKISAEEGKKMVDEILSKGETKATDLENKVKEFSSKFKKKTEEEQLEDLKKQVADLEAKLGKIKPAPKAAAVK